MIEKRFTRDNHTGYFYDNGEIVEDIMELLNSLNDENEQLKIHMKSAKAHLEGGHTKKAIKRLEIIDIR